MTVESLQAERRAAEVELHQSGSVVDVLEAFDDRTYGRRSGGTERYETARESPARVGRISRDAGEVRPQMMVRVTGPKDVIPATLGHFYGGVAEEGGMAATFRNDPEVVLTMDDDAIYRERFAFVQDDFGSLVIA
jgi:hypothetical protein